MDNVIRLNKAEIESADTFSEQVRTGEITHGIACYRKKDGSVNYFLIAPEHSTYIVGMIERVKLDLSLNS